MSDQEIDLAMLVIGYGNPLRGDDAVGWFVARAVEQAVGSWTRSASLVRALAVHQLTPELAEPISRSRSVVFVDAAHGSSPGTVRWINLEPAESGGSPMAHDLEPAQLLALTRQWYGRCPPARLAAVTGESFGYRDGLSSSVLSAVGQIVAHLMSTSPI